MPTYDFICNSCDQRFDIFMTFNEYGAKPKIKCVHCKSTDVRRRMTKVRIAKSEESRTEAMVDKFSGLDGLEDDPKALGQVMRRMKGEMGDEMGDDIPAEFDEVVDRLESGQSPEDIESAMPDLGADDTSDA